MSDKNQTLVRLLLKLTNKSKLKAKQLANKIIKFERGGSNSKPGSDEDHKIEREKF